jgi:hypothetical protein
MKFQLLFSFLFALLACNDNTADKPTSKTPQKKDTAVVNAPPQNPYANVDVSPMDISYYPTDYPLQKMSGNAASLPVMRVIYSRPHRQGRKIFGNLLHYGEPWRLGANEATEIELFQPITIQDKKIPKGRYVLYCIPYQDHWVIIFNSNLYSWGLKPLPEKDLYKFDIAVERAESDAEYFTMVFEKIDDGNVNLHITWDEVLVHVLIKI